MLRTLTILLVIITMSACTGVPFNVKPRVDLPAEQIANRAATASVDLRAELVSENEAETLFDGNIWLAGVIPVRVALTNKSAAVIESDDLKFSLVDETGRRFPLLKPKDAFKKMIDYYGVRFYNLALHEEMKDRFLNYGAALNNGLLPAESQQGMLFFKHVKEAAEPAGLRLELIEDKGQPVVIKLN